MIINTLTVIFALVTTCVNSSRILCIFPTPSISHQFVYQPIWKTLSLRGHQVTVITPNPLRDPNLTNLTEIDVSGVYEIQDKNDAKIAKKLTLEELVHIALVAPLPLHDHMLRQKEVKKIIQGPSNLYDLVMIEAIQPLFFAFAQKFNCPVVGITSCPDAPLNYIFSRAPINPIAYPYAFGPPDNVETIWQRVKHLWSFLANGMLYTYYTVVPKHQEIARKHFGEDIGHLGDTMYNMSLVFITRNVFINRARALPPNVVDIGRIHIQKDPKLPRDLQKYLDSANEGVVYFSLGSSVKTVLIEDKKKAKILKALYRLPYKVLWKYENTTHPEISRNILTRKWFPQQAVLNHKNVKVFVTQGGMQSLEEGIHYRVPMVGMSFFGDQHFNVDRMDKLGIAKSVDYNTFTSHELKEAITEVATNKSYKQKLNEIADALEDEPMKSLDKVIFWTEYVIKHKGAKFLRSDALELPLYKLLGLDIILLFAVNILLMFYVLHSLCHKLFNYITRNFFIQNKKKN